MRPWTGSWRWIMLILLAWGTLLFYIGGHLVRDNDHPDRSSRELSKILAKLERLKQQNEDLRRMAESLRIPEGPIDQGPASAGRVRALEEQLIKAKEQIENFRKQAGDGQYSILDLTVHSEIFLEVSAGNLSLFLLDPFPTR
ncbi:UNVERIFIED_CONTAM: hypothetical protein FKN15_047169 [Acipenser sinensis]